MPDKTIPERIWAELDSETNEKRWYSVKGMGEEYVRADLADRASRPAEQLVKALREWLAAEDAYAPIVANVAVPVIAAKANARKALAAYEASGSEKQATGDRICESCGRENPVWYAETDLWNEVNGSANGVLCPTCFIVKAEKIGPSVWKVSRQPDPVTKAVEDEREAITERIRHFAADYPQDSDGRNTLLLIAEWIDRRGAIDAIAALRNRGGES